jgi:dTDP-4-dehydrorhamnose 3,5-epimerase
MSSTTGNGREKALPEGAWLKRIETHEDGRGRLGEVFRQEWSPTLRPLQWAVISSRANVLRGVHVHPKHDDYLVVLSGHAAIGLADMRPEGEGFTPMVVEMSGDDLSALAIPHGIAHGFYFYEDTLVLLGASEYYDPADELPCRWDDPDLAIPWPDVSPVISERDARAPGYAELTKLLEQRSAQVRAHQRSLVDDP